MIDPAIPPEGALSRSAMPGSIISSYGSQKGIRHSGSQFARLAAEIAAAAASSSQ